MVRMDKLLEAWRADPKVEATVELCAMLIRAALKAAPQKLLPDNFVVMFASEARAKHPSNLDVAIAVTDLYLVSGLMKHAAAVMEMAEKLAPQDNRVKERLGKVQRSPTKEFPTSAKPELRATDPETLDAPTTPLDPPTERGVFVTNPVRRPTTIGLAGAPPPLPAPIDRRPKVGLPRGSVVDKQEVTEGDTHTETNTHTLSEVLPHPRRQKTALFGVVDEVDGDSPPTKVNATAPPGNTNVALGAPAEREPGPKPKAPPEDAPTKVAASAPAMADEDDAPPTAVQVVDERMRALSERPTLVEPSPTPTRAGPPIGGPPIGGPPTGGPPTGAKPAPGTPSAANPVPRTLSSEVSSKELRDKLPGAAKQRDDAWAKKPDPSSPAAAPPEGAARPAAQPFAIPPVPKADDDDSPPTRVESSKDPADSAAHSDSKVAARKPQPERRPLRSFPALEEAPDLPTKVGETPGDLFGPVTGARPPRGGGASPRIAGARPSEPETVTTTNVRALPVVPPRRPEAPTALAGPRPGAPAPPERNPRASLGDLGEPSTLSGAITNLWSPADSPARPRPVVEDSQSVLDVSPQDLLDDDDDAAVTGLKDPAPLLSASMQRPSTGISAPSVAPPVVKGGTLAMQVQNAPSAFRSVPAGLEDDDSDVPRTQVLNAQEAMRAAVTSDPRPPHAASRGPSAPARSAPAVMRGVMVGTADPSLPSPPPAVVPTFGAPPPRPSPLLQSGMNPTVQLGSFAAPASLASSGSQAAASGPHAKPFSLSGQHDVFTGVALAATPGQQALEVPPVAMSPAQVADPLSLVPLDALQRPLLASQEVFVPPSTAQSMASPVRLAPVPSGRVPVKLYVTLAAAMLAVFGLVAYAAYLLLRTPDPPAQTNAGRVPKAVEDALVTATPSSLAFADVELTKLEAQSSPELAAARLKQRVLTALEVSGAGESLAEAIEKARGQGADDATLGFALVAEATLRNDLPLAAKRAEPARVSGEKNAMFRYVNGLLLERLGSPDARSEYASAISLSPGFSPPKLRLLRLQVLAGESEPLLAAKEEGALDDATLAAFDAWAWAVSAANGRGAAEPPTLSMTSADVSRTLHPVFSAVAMLKKAPDPKGAATDPTLKQAILDAESPHLAAFFGAIASHRGDEVSTVLAAERALALAPSFAQAIALLAENALRTGRYQELVAGSKALSPITSGALRSLVAYESGDAAGLAALAKSDIPSVAELSQVRLSLLVGPTLPNEETMADYRRKDPVHGDLCAVDRLILLGELAEAKKIVAAWPNGDTHAARALRVGRLLRAEGAFTEADKVLLVAPAGWYAQLERALVGAESRESRARARSLATDERAGPAGPLVEAFIIARNGDVDLAKAKLASAKLPSDGSPWLERIVATLALVEVDDAQGATWLSNLSAVLPKNTDLNRAAVRAAERKASVDQDEEPKEGSPVAPRPRNR